MKVDGQCEYNFGRKKKRGNREWKEYILMYMQQNVKSGYLYLQLSALSTFWAI